MSCCPHGQLHGQPKLTIGHLPAARRRWNAAVGLRDTLAKMVGVLRKEAKASGTGRLIYC